MRLVLLGPFALSPKGTVSQRVLPLGRALVRRGHQVWLLVPPYDNPAERGSRFEDEGVQVDELAAGGLAGWVKDLVGRTSEIAPDVVHLFKPVGPAAVAALALSTRFPIVLDQDDWEGRGRFASTGAYPPAVAAAIDLQERLTPRVVRQITVASRTLGQRARRRGFASERVHYLPNCVERSNLGRTASAEEVAAFRVGAGAGDDPIVLYLGHVPPANDLDLAAAALAPLAEAGQAFRWVLVGDGPGLATLRASLPSALAARTSFPGRVARKGLPAAFAASRLLLVPARDTPINRAKCAMKVVDSLAAGLPVVASDVGQHREYVVPDVTGLLAPTEDIASLTHAVLRLLENEDLARRLGVAAAARMRWGYTWDHWAGQAERAYRLALIG